MKKQIIDDVPGVAPQARERWLDLDSCAEVRLTSEDPGNPIEGALEDGRATGWRAAKSGAQTIWLHFVRPQAIREVQLRFEATEHRTQEFVILWSGDGGVTYHEIVRQQFNFSPGASLEQETYLPNLSEVTDLKLTIIPDISGGSARAALRALRLR